MSKPIEFCPSCGEILTDPDDHSDAARRRFFAIIKECFDTLPDHWKPLVQTSEHLRKLCLIEVGYCDTTATDCGSKAAAERVAGLVQGMDGFAIVKVEGPVVVVARARSMQKRVCPKAKFLPLAQAVYDHLSKMLGTIVS